MSSSIYKWQSCGKENLKNSNKLHLSAYWLAKLKLFQDILAFLIKLLTTVVDLIRPFLKLSYVWACYDNSKFIFQ